MLLKVRTLGRVQGSHRERVGRRGNGWFWETGRGIEEKVTVAWQDRQCTGRVCVGEAVDGMR